jgi:long-chain acyl-CoA synthetase
MLLSLVGFILRTIDVLAYYVITFFYGKTAISWDLKDTSGSPVAVPIGTEKPSSETRVYRNIRSLDGKVKPMVDGVSTLDELFRHVTKQHENKPCIGSRKVLAIKKVNIDGKMMDTFEFDKIKWTTYGEVAQKVERVASGIVELTGLNSGDKLAIYENTCPEWQYVCQACLRYGIQVVTVYASLGLDALVTSLNETKITAIFAGEELLPHFVKIGQQVPTLKYVIFNPDRFVPKENPIPANILNHIKVVSIQEVEELGGTVKPPKINKVPTTDDIAFIMYTSGTTGTPKGVIHRQDTLFNVVQAAIFGLNLPTHTLVHLAYLPLAHIFEFGLEVAILTLGSKIVFGNPKTLADKFAKPMGDLRAAKPSILFGVPRVYDTLKKAALEIINDPAKTKPLVKSLFDIAYEAKKSALLAKRDTPLFNKLVFSKFKQQLGGNVTVIGAAGAPLSKETQEFMRICFCASVIQIYGLTEVGASTLQISDRPVSYKNVGPTIPGVDIKLLDVPEMDYLSTDNPPRGEIAIKGLGVCSGYYNQPEKTKEVFMEDGWFHTGDIGVIDEQGYLSVIDRRKNLVKLSAGEYIALERLESVYANSRFLVAGGICVYADPYRDHAVANVLVQPSQAKKWAIENYKKEVDVAEICAVPAFRKIVLEDLNEQAKAAKLHKFEWLGDIRVHAEEWTPENGMLTAAMKVQRHVINKKYANDIEQMYQSARSQ